MENVKRMREILSDCDREIIKLMEKRLEMTIELLEYKKKEGLPILQPNQEYQHIKDIEEQIEESPYKLECQELLDALVKVSKQCLTRHLFTYNIMLIGFMGTGKSTVSQYLSQVLEMEEMDTDAMIVEKEGSAIADIFEKEGEEYFRNCESSTLVDLCSHERKMVSCGGGVVLRDENVSMMRQSGRIVLLTAQPSTILERVKHSSERPLLNGQMTEEHIEALMHKREDKYRAAADIVVATDNKRIHEIAEEIVAKLIGFDRRNSN